MRSMLKSKIHRIRVTGVNLDYEGSISIDRGLMELADILPFEKVQVLNLNNAARFETYAIEGGPGEVSLNGAAARLAAPGDRVIIITYTFLPDDQARRHQPRVVLVDEHNQPRVNPEV